MTKVDVSRATEAKIRRLTAEIIAIERFFYGGEADGDRFLYAGMLERKRDDLVRGVVLQLHTAIEDILNTAIACRVLDVNPENRLQPMRSVRGRALQKMLAESGSLGFAMKLNFAVALGLMTTAIRDKLLELNTLRNKCSHNWLLNVKQRRGKRPDQKKPPLLRYQGRDLHNIAVLEKFAADYGTIYVRMFGRYL